MNIAIFFNPSLLKERPNLSPRQLQQGWLIPGCNWMSEADWQKVSKHPNLKAYIDCDGLKRFEPSATDLPADRTSSYRVVDATEIVRGSYELVQLRAWLKDERREAVREAIATQIELLEKIGCPEKFERHRAYMTIAEWWYQSLQDKVFSPHFCAGQNERRLWQGSGAA